MGVILSCCPRKLKKPLQKSPDSSSSGSTTSLAKPEEFGGRKRLYRLNAAFEGRFESELHEFDMCAADIINARLLAPLSELYLRISWRGAFDACIYASLQRGWPLSSPNDIEEIRNNPALGNRYGVREIRHVKIWPPPDKDCAMQQEYTLSERDPHLWRDINFRPRDPRIDEIGPGFKVVAKEALVLIDPYARLRGVNYVEIVGGEIFEIKRVGVPYGSGNMDIAGPSAINSRRMRPNLFSAGSKDRPATLSFNRVRKVNSVDIPFVGDTTGNAVRKVSSVDPKSNLSDGRGDEGVAGRASLETGSIEPVLSNSSVSGSQKQQSLKRLVTGAPQVAVEKIGSIGEMLKFPCKGAVSSNPPATSSAAPASIPAPMDDFDKSPLNIRESAPGGPPDGGGIDQRLSEISKHTSKISLSEELRTSRKQPPRLGRKTPRSGASVENIMIRGALKPYEWGDNTPHTYENEKHIIGKGMEVVMAWQRFLNRAHLGDVDEIPDKLSPDQINIEQKARSNTLESDDPNPVFVPDTRNGVNKKSKLGSLVQDIFDAIPSAEAVGGHNDLVQLVLVQQHPYLRQPNDEVDTTSDIQDVISDTSCTSSEKIDSGFWVRRKTLERIFRPHAVYSDASELIAKSRRNDVLRFYYHPGKDFKPRLGRHQISYEHLQTQGRLHIQDLGVGALFHPKDPAMRTSGYDSPPSGSSQGVLRQLSRTSDIMSRPSDEFLYASFALRGQTLEAVSEDWTEYSHAGVSDAKRNSHVQSSNSVDSQGTPFIGDRAGYNKVMIGGRKPKSAPSGMPKATDPPAVHSESSKEVQSSKTGSKEEETIIEPSAIDVSSLDGVGSSGFAMRTSPDLTIENAKASAKDTEKPPVKSALEKPAEGKATTEILSQTKEAQTKEKEGLEPKSTTVGAIKNNEKLPNKGGEKPVDPVNQGSMDTTNPDSSAETPKQFNRETPENSAPSPPTSPRENSGSLSPAADSAKPAVKPTPDPHGNVKAHNTKVEITKPAQTAIIANPEAPAKPVKPEIVAKTLQSAAGISNTKTAAEEPSLKKVPETSLQKSSMENVPLGKPTEETIEGKTAQALSAKTPVETAPPKSIAAVEMKPEPAPVVPKQAENKMEVARKPVAVGTTSVVSTIPEATTVKENPPSEESPVRNARGSSRNDSKSMSRM